MPCCHADAFAHQMTYSSARRMRQRAERGVHFRDPLLSYHMCSSLLAFWGLSFFCLFLKSLSRSEDFYNHIQTGSFVVNRSLGTSPTSVPLWHLSPGYMQGIMRNISLHLLLLCELQKKSCVQKPKGQKCLEHYHFTTSESTLSTQSYSMLSILTKFSHDITYDWTPPSGGRSISSVCLNSTVPVIYNMNHSSPHKQKPCALFKSQNKQNCFQLK